MTDPTRNADAFPVQDTNVSLVLGNALTREYPLVLKRIEATTALLAALHRYELWMQNVAAVAGFDLPTLARESEDVTPSRFAVLPDGERVPMICFASATEGTDTHAP